MNPFLAVVAREFQEWKRIFVVALAAGCLALLAPLLPTGSGSPVQSINVAAGAISVAFAIGFGLLAGATALGRDLSERRMSFYFCKPLTAFSIGGGKLGTAMLLTVISTVAIVLPATVAGGGFAALQDPAMQKSLAIAFGGGIAAVIGANSASLIFRTRSSRAVFDVMALLAISALVAVALYPLARNLAFGLIRILGLIFLGFLLLAFLIGTMVGLGRGRTELPGVHRAHSITAWSLGAIGAFTLIGYSQWALSAEPRDLDLHLIETPPAGPWLAISGGSMLRGDLRPMFLVNPEKNQTQRIGGGWLPEPVRFSCDGTHAVWLEPVGLSRADAVVMIATLEWPVKIKRTGIRTAPQLATLALSPSGRRIALEARGTLTVFDANSERVLASTPIPRTADHHQRIRFADERIVRLYKEVSRSDLYIYEFDVDRSRFRRVGGIERAGPAHFTISSRDDSTVRVHHESRHYLHDAKTGRRLFEVSPGARVLASGTVVSAASLNGRAILYVKRPDAAVDSVIQLGTGRSVRLGGEVAPSKIVLAVSPVEPLNPGDFQKSSSLLLVDLASGSVRKVASKLSPPQFLWRHEGVPAAGAASTKVFETADSKLAYFDPQNGTFRMLERNE